MQLQLKQITTEQLEHWQQWADDGVDGLSFAPLADGGPGAEVVYHLSKAHLCIGVPLRWALRYFIVDTSAGCVAGMIGFRNGPIMGWLEIGYSVAPEYQGQGVATWAVGALLRQSLETDPHLHFFARAFPDNLSSRKVLEKSGFDYDGTTIAENGMELVVYRLSAEAAKKAA